MRSVDLFSLLLSKLSVNRDLSRRTYSALALWYIDFAEPMGTINYAEFHEVLSWGAKQEKVIASVAEL